MSCKFQGPRAIKSASIASVVAAGDNTCVQQFDKVYTAENKQALYCEGRGWAAQALLLSVRRAGTCIPVYIQGQKALSVVAK